MWRPKVILGVGPQSLVFGDRSLVGPGSGEPQESPVLASPVQGLHYLLHLVLFYLNTGAWDWPQALRPAWPAFTNWAVSSVPLSLIGSFFLLSLFHSFLPCFSFSFIPQVYVAQAGLYSQLSSLCLLSAGILVTCHRTCLTPVLQIFILTHIKPEIVFMLFKSSIKFWKVLESVSCFIKFTECLL